MYRITWAIAALWLSAVSAFALEECRFNFEVDTEGTARQSLIDEASKRGGFWRPINEAPDDVRQLGRFVGRLDICLTTSDGKPRPIQMGQLVRERTVVTSYCTATLLPGNRLITNDHCFYEPTLIEAGFTVVLEARINFLYTSEDLKDQVRTFRVDTREIARDQDLDALVLRILAGNANDALGGHVPMVMETSPDPRRALTMVHHPFGQPQQFSSGTCQIHPRQADISAQQSQLRHTCETEVGSSGSLLLDARTLAVVGLHNQGGLDRKRGFNGGHKIEAVEAALDLGFVASGTDTAPVTDPEVDAQNALFDALDLANPDDQRAAMMQVIAEYPTTRAAARAETLLQRLAPAPDPEAVAFRALAEAMLIAEPAARVVALEAVIAQFPDSGAASSARSALALVAPVAPNPQAEASKALIAAMSLSDPAAQRTALEAVIAGFPGTVAAENAETQLASMAPPAPDLSAMDTLTIKADGSGDLTSLADAIAVAKSGARLEVYPGAYTESSQMVVDKPLTIVGMGDAEKIVVTLASNIGVEWTAASGRIENLTLTHTGSNHGVIFNGGAGVLESSILTSAKGSPVGLANGADPAIRDNLIRNSGKYGVYVYANARGTIEGNTIERNKKANIAIRTDSTTLVRNNDIRNTAGIGIEIYESAKPRVIANTISGSGTYGLYVHRDAAPDVRGNTITTSKKVGILVLTRADGTFEDNAISKTAATAIQVGGAANPVFRNNDVFENEGSGIFVHSGGRGTFESNELFGQKSHGFLIKAGSDPVIKGNTIRDGRAGDSKGIWLWENGKGTITSNTITKHSFGVYITDGSDPVIRDNLISQNQIGVYLNYQAKGRIENNDLRRNFRDALQVSGNPNYVYRNNTE